MTLLSAFRFLARSGFRAHGEALGGSFWPLLAPAAHLGAHFGQSFANFGNLGLILRQFWPIFLVNVDF